MLVYVINKNGNPLMPCKPSKARKLLRDKKAKIVNYARSQFSFNGTVKNMFKKCP